MRLFTTLSLALLPTLSLSAEQFKYYSIWPKDPLDHSTNGEITKYLREQAVVKSELYISESKHLGNLYWFAPLTDEDRKHVAEHAGPVKVPANKRRRRDIIKQENAPDSLKFISQAPSERLDKVQDYIYDERAGNGIRIFVIDTGLQENHPEFSDVSKSIGWMFPGPFAEEVKNDADVENGHGHGTCMASVALGKLAGVAKKADLTMVRVNIPDESVQSSLGAEIYIDALAQVYDNIHGKHEGKAVINMSNGVVPVRQPGYETFNDAVRATYARIIEGLNKLGAPVVVAAGQGNGPEDIGDEKPKTLPQILAYKELPDLIVVSGVDLDGDYDYGFEDRSLKNTLYAPGEVTCASNSADEYHGIGREREAGNSPAAAMVSGLLSHHMSTGLTAEEALVRIKDDSYIRKGADNPRKAVYIGMVMECD